MNVTSNLDSHLAASVMTVRVDIGPVILQHRRHTILRASIRADQGARSGFRPLLAGIGETQARPELAERCDPFRPEAVERESPPHGSRLRGRRDGPEHEHHGDEKHNKTITKHGNTPPSRRSTGTAMAPAPAGATPLLRCEWP